MKKWIKAITLASLIMVQGAWLQAASAAKAEMRIYMAQEESSKRALETMLDMLGLRLNTNAINTRPISGKFSGFQSHVPLRTNSWICSSYQTQLEHTVRNPSPHGT